MAKIKSNLKYLLALFPIFGANELKAQETEPVSSGGENSAASSASAAPNACFSARREARCGQSAHSRRLRYAVGSSGMRCRGAVYSRPWCALRHS